MAAARPTLHGERDGHEFGRTLEAPWDAFQLVKSSSSSPGTEELFAIGIRARSSGGEQRLASARFPPLVLAETQRADDRAPRGVFMRASNLDDVQWVQPLRPDLPEGFVSACGCCGDSVVSREKYAVCYRNVSRALFVVVCALCTSDLEPEDPWPGVAAGEGDS